MYTHKILPTIISNGDFLSSELIDKSVRQVVFNNDSLLRPNDIALLQDIPLTQLNTISQYLNKNICISQKEKPSISQNTLTNITIQFPLIKGYIDLDYLYSFELPSIEINLVKPLLSPVTLYLLLKKVINNTSNEFKHLPITLRPVREYESVEALYSLNPIDSYIAYPLLKLFEKKGKYEIRPIDYGLYSDSSYIKNSINSVTFNTSYIASGLQVSVINKTVQISPGIVFINGVRVISPNTVKIDLTNSAYKGNNYHVNINPSHIWLSDNYLLDSSKESLTFNPLLTKTSQLILGKIKVRVNKLHYIEFIPRVNSNWYSNISTRLDSISSLTSSLLSTTNISSTSNLHITDFKLNGDTTQIDYSISYINNKYPCPLSRQKVIPLKNLLLAAVPFSIPSEGNNISLISINNQVIPIIDVPIEGGTPSILISISDLFIGLVINTPLIDISNNVISLTQLISRLRGFKPYTTITSLYINNKPLDNSTTTLGLNGSSELTLNTIEEIGPSYNQYTIRHESKDINIPVLDINPIYITSTPSYLIGQTFTVGKTISIAHIGTYIINTEYIRSLIKYSPLIAGVCVYKIGGNSIDTETLFYFGEYRLSNSTSNNIYLDSNPILSTQLTPGKYVIVFIPYVHPLEIATTSNSYVDGGRCTVTGKLQTISEEINNDIAFTIKGCYVLPNITPRTIRLGLDNTQEIFPFIDNTLLKINDPLNQLLGSTTTISTQNNKTDISITLSNNKYISLEALSLTGIIYAEKGIWVSKPILINRTNLIDLKLVLTCHLPGISKVIPYVSVDSNNSFIALEQSTLEGSNNFREDILITYTLGLSITISRYIIIKLEMMNDIREKDILYIKEVLIKPIY